MKTSLKLALASLLFVSHSAFAFNDLGPIAADMIAASNAALAHGGIHSVDDRLQGLARLEATNDCAALGVVAGEEYLLFSVSNGFAFRASDANQNISIPSRLVYGIDLSEIGSNYNDSQAPVAIRTARKFCHFVLLPSR